MRRILFICFSLLIVVSLVLAFLSFKNKEWETLTATISLTIAIISGWIAFEAFYRQSLTNKPQIITRIDFKSRYGLGLLIVENLGSKPAFNINFIWNKELKNFKGEKVRFGKSNSEFDIPVLNPNESTSTIIGTPLTIYDKSEDLNLNYDGK